MNNFLLASAALLFASTTISARQSDNNTDFYFNIYCYPRASYWSGIDNSDTSVSTCLDNLSDWQADNFTLYSSYLIVGINWDQATTAAIYNKTAIPTAIARLEVEKTVSGTSTVKSRKLIVSTDADFMDNCHEYDPDPNESTKIKDVYLVSEPVENSYYRIEYNVGYTNPGRNNTNYEYIRHLNLYPEQITDTPLFFTTSKILQVISETGELRTHACYYDINGKPLPGNTGCTATDLTDTSDYETTPVYYSAQPDKTVFVQALPETYSAANNVDAKYLTVWAQTYKDGKLSEMVTRTYGESGNIFTGIHEIFTDASTGDVSTRYFDLQGNQIKSAEYLPAGTLYIRLDSNGARKLTR